MSFWKFIALVPVIVGISSLNGGCAVKHKRDAEADKIIEAYKAEKEQVKNCYYKALEQNSGLQGEVTLAWVVSGKGALKRAWVKNSTIQDADMESCLLEHLKTVAFPETKNLAKITVEYTLTFSR